MHHSSVSIQTEDFDVSAELMALRSQDKRVGAVCSFVGTVRGSHQSDTEGGNSPPVLSM